METKSRIFIVDDNKELCTNICDILEENGYTVEYANNGKDAIVLLQKNRYDIALVDVKLPDIPGAELIKKLMSISPSTEFIYITAYASLDSAIEAVKQEHVVSYETKPLDMNRLLSILMQVTKRRKVEDQIRKLSHAVEQSPSVVMITDLKGKIEFVNSKFTQLTGFSIDEAIGQLPSILKSDKTSPEVYKELWKTITSGKEWRGEFCNKKKKW